MDKNDATCFAQIASVLMFLIATLLPGVASAQDGPVKEPRFVCMMQDSLMLKPGIPIEHEGKTYYRCCPMCSKSIKQDPERFTRAKDPVTGATVDKATAFIYGLGGSAYYFESEATRETFGRDPGRFIGKPEPAGGPTLDPSLGPDTGGETTMPGS